MQKKLLLGVLTLVALCACQNESRQVDLIVYNAVIYSVDSSFGVHQAMAIKNGRIVEVGSEKAILNAYNSSQKTNLMGKTVFPGFIDAHCHFVGYGLGLNRVSLVGTKSFAEVLQKVKEFTANKPPTDANAVHLKGAGNSDWIIGRGWDQNDWETKTMPDNRALDSLFPNTPVFLTRIDGHAAIANTAALTRAGITPQTKIAGGELLKTGNRLSGVLVDNAVDLLKAVLPQANASALAGAALIAQEHCLAQGLTTVDDAGLMKRDIDVLDALHQNGQLKLRVYAMLSDSSSNYDHYLKNGPYKTERLNVRAFKFYADGALGSRGACLMEAYNDKKNWKGFLLSEQKHFEEKALLMAKRGFQMATHCIGDSAYRIILSAYKKAGATKAERWRIEHAQVVNPSDMKNSDQVIPSVQPTHATSDMYWVADRLGEERSRHAYAYKELLHVAGLVALGTDFPVEDISPFKTFYAAVARQDAKGFPAGGFQPENALSREETLKGMTIWAAYANFEEHEKGSLEAGKYADFVVLDTDLMKCALSDILKTKVHSTYISGERVYSLR